MTILKRITNELAETHASHKMGSICFPIRTTIVQLKSGDLWVHSPGPVNDETLRSIRAMGDVRYIVAPNLLHHTYVQGFTDAFPTAELWGAPGLAKKRKDLEFTNMLGEVHPWRTEIDARFIEGAPLLNETVFFHESEATMICTDLLFNFVEFENLMTKLVLWPTGATRGLVQSRSWWMFAKNRKQVGAAAASMLEWDFKRILMAHGEMVEGDNLGKRFSEIIRWLPDQATAKMLESKS